MVHVGQLFEAGQVAEDAHKDEDQNGSQVDPDDFRNEQENGEGKQRKHHAHLKCECNMFQTGDP